jgi:hypothetical protein
MCNFLDRPIAQIRACGFIVATAGIRTPLRNASTLAFAVIATTLIMVLGPRVAARPETSPIKGIQTKEIGIGAGFCVPPDMYLTWDSVANALNCQVKSVNPCPEYPIIGHWVAYGEGFLQVESDIGGSIFVDGAWLYIDAEGCVGPFLGGKSAHPIPADPSLPGTIITIQSIIQYGGPQGPLTPFGVTAAQLVLFVG